MTSCPPESSMFGTNLCLTLVCDCRHFPPPFLSRTAIALFFFTHQLWFPCSPFMTSVGNLRWIVTEYYSSYKYKAFSAQVHNDLMPLLDAHPITSKYVLYYSPTDTRNRGQFINECLNREMCNDC